ncbi:MAG: amidohydrolase [Oscillospiraceae bacterium]
MNTIYFNGKIYLERDNFAPAMLVTDGIIKAVGDLHDVENQLTGDCQRVDLQGKTVLPGFNDSHLHILSVGVALACVVLHGVTSMAEILEKGREFLRLHPMTEGDVLVGRGWNQDYFTDENRLPTRYDLDKITTDFPVIYTRACGHMCVGNSKALQVAKIDRNTLPNEGGEIYKDENGEPNGLFSENAQAQLISIVPKDTPEKMAKDLSLAMEYAASCGVTSVQTCDIRQDNWRNFNEAFKILYATDKNAIRTYHQSNFSDPVIYKEFIDAGCGTKNGDAMFKYGPLKMFVDGSLGARTAYMREAYADDPTTRGISTMSVEHFDKMVKTADENGCQVAVHCIGDAAIEMVLNAYAKVIKGKNNTNRHGIVHCQITDEALVDRFLENDVLAYVQPIFIHYDMNVVAQRVGEKLASTSYAFGDMLRKGIHTSYGTDSPVENLNPFENLYCAVTRKRLDGAKEYLPEQAVDIYDAVDQYTIGSAYASFEEGVKGRIKSGYYADFTVLDRDIFTIPSDEIKDVKAVATYLNGRQIFAR